MSTTMRNPNNNIIKLWANKVTIEDEAIQQAFNIASLPFIHKWVALMPDAHVGIGSTVGSVIATDKAIIPASVGVDIGCFHGDTKIPLLNGTQKTLKELIRCNESFWVYSIDKNLNIAPGKATAVQTRKKMPLMKITISGGEEIICTPDHLFMLKDGTYLEAQKLKLNQSLMPLYRKWHTRDGYEAVGSGKGTYKKTYKLVWESFHGNISKGDSIHHKNHNHFDNTPENLKLMSRGEHSRHHRINGNKFDNYDENFQEKRKEGIKKSMLRPRRLAQCKEIGTKNIMAYMKDRPDHFKQAVAANGKRGAPYLKKFNTSPLKCADCEIEVKNPTTLKWHRKKQHGYNHKVIVIEHLKQTEDVYCLQVEKYNNFALSAGVFVHNCGMMAIQTTLKAADLPDNLRDIRHQIERDIPVGFNKYNDKTLPDDEYFPMIYADLEFHYKPIIDKYPQIKTKDSPIYQLGTLGGGNHFIEICLDEHQNVWIMLHSGSRGIGNNIGRFFIEKAKKEMEKYFISLPDKDLAYLSEDTELFNDYIECVDWAQWYAAENRKIMLGRTISALQRYTQTFTIVNEAINCHHNYVQKENHYGKNIYVTRKGAVSAREGQLGIIPGSMGAKSYIVEGLGNIESFQSCAHGAGRSMSRKKARDSFNIDDLIKSTDGVECRKDANVIDEIPMAYKDIDAVMESQKDLVKPVAILKQVLCVKG